MLDRFEEILEIVQDNKVTDIHFTIKETHITIDLRGLDGFFSIAACEEDRGLIRHLKYLADIDLSNSLKPQTGAFSYIFNQQELYFRLAVLNTFFAESCVIRILNPDIIEEENISPLIKQQIFTKIENYRNGLVLLSGATGSGKTTSMYSLLQLFTSLNKKIYCIEDPVEIHFPNVMQIQVNEKKALNYQEGIKHLLRHDPDIIVIGEIRDSEEAKMAIRCALTGHLVITTIHSKSSEGVINRLLDLGVKLADIQETLVFVAYQQLYQVKKGSGRLCLYETMAKNEIDYFFKEGKHSQTFYRLSEIEKFAKERNIIQ